LEQLSRYQLEQEALRVLRQQVTTQTVGTGVLVVPPLSVLLRFQRRLLGWLAILGLVVRVVKAVILVAALVAALEVERCSPQNR
jgi:hypothetical protein